ncbi:hypothetical protein ACFL6I_22990, partial [candidate division KSB1 bacterium]
MNRNNIFSEKYNELFRDNLIEFINNIRRCKNTNLYNKEFSLFYPIIGKSFRENPELLVIGRYFNGLSIITKFTA